MSRFDQIAKDWDTKPRRVMLAENVFNSSKSKINLTKDLSVLDIGTGTGLLLMHFQPFVGKITGLDNSAGMLQMLKEKAQKFNLKNIDYLNFNADTDTLQTNQYDLVISSMTFHHLSQPESFIKQVYSALKPGGKVCIGDLDKEDGSFHTNNEEVDVKFFGFERKEFNHWLINTGFKNTSVENIFEIDKNNKKYPVFLAYGEKPKD